MLGIMTEEAEILEHPVEHGLENTLLMFMRYFPWQKHKQTSSKYHPLRFTAQFYRSPRNWRKLLYQDSYSIYFTALVTV